MATSDLTKVETLVTDYHAVYSHHSDNAGHVSEE